MYIQGVISKHVVSLTWTHVCPYTPFSYLYGSCLSGIEFGQCHKVRFCLWIYGFFGTIVWLEIDLNPCANELGESRLYGLLLI